MSGNKIGFNEITEIGFNGNYGEALNDRLKAINDNFQKIANADYMKGVDGDDVRVLHASFTKDDLDLGNPLGEGYGNLYYNGGETPITKNDLYNSIFNCIYGLATEDNEKAGINGINWYDDLDNNSIMIIADEENGNYYLKSSLYFVYNDPRFANPIEDATYGNLKNLSCVVIYNGQDWVASQPFPKIYYFTEVNDFCWEINGQRTQLRARGPQGLSGQNYPVWLCYSSKTSIQELTQDNNPTLSIQIEGIYRLNGTNYVYITQSDSDDSEWKKIIKSGEFKNNMALCIVDLNPNPNQLYCGYLYNQGNNLYMYTTQNSAINTIIGHETLYSLLKSNLADNTIHNSLFIPTTSVNTDDDLLGKQIYSIYGHNEEAYRTFNIGVSTVNNDKTLKRQYGRTKLNLWSGEINLFTHETEGGIKNNALQITPDKIDINRNLISLHDSNGKPQRHIQMKLPESYLTFESYVQRNLSDSLSPIDTAMNPEACANRLSFYNPDLVDIEYSANGGETWEDCFDNPDDVYKIKTKLLTTGFKDTLSNLYLGRKYDVKNPNPFSNKDKLRVSIYIKPGEFYGKLDKLNLYTTFRPATGLKMNCKIYLYKITETASIDRDEFNENIKNYYTKETWGEVNQETTNPLKWVLVKSNPTAESSYIHGNLSGEPGWNSISLDDSNLVGGYNNANDSVNFIANRIYKIVLEFGLEDSSANSGAQTDVARVGGIRLFGSKWYVIKDKNGNTNSLAGYNSICSWDENCVAVFPSGVSNQFKITYKKLKDLADNGKLVSGTKYRIIDYIPKFNETDIKSGEHQFDIIVEAVDNKTLSEKANAVLHDGDKYFENSKLSKWELKYSLNTSGFDWAAADDPGVIYYMKDEFDNEAPYDFKNVMYILNVSNDDPNARNYIIYSLMNKYKTNIITKYLTDYPDQFDPTALQNLKAWIQKGAQIMLTYNCPSCLFYTFSSIYIDNLKINSMDSANISCSFDIKTKDYSFTEFCHNNVLGKNSLYNIFIAAIEQSGKFYITKNNKLDINCTNNIFGENCTNNNFAGYCSFNYFENTCRDNNCDEYFKGNKLGSHSNNNAFGKNCGNNIIKSHLMGSVFGDNCDNNTFEADVSIKSTSDNDTSYEHVKVNFGEGCSNNNLGQRCYDITFGNNCSNNNLGQKCYDIKFGNNCSNNNLGQKCYDIYFSNNCSNNNLGSNNSTIKTCSKSMLTNCTIGNGCEEILFLSPRICNRGTKTSPIIYDTIGMHITGAKIENNCGGFIISIFNSQIIEIDNIKYVSFLLYNTDSDAYYTDTGFDYILKHRIFKYPIHIIQDNSLILINGLNISNGTSRYRISDSGLSTVSGDVMPIAPTKSFDKMTINDLDNIFVNYYMIAITDPFPYNNFALSCKPLIFNKSEGVFSMKCTKSNTDSADSYHRVESIVADFK